MSHDARAADALRLARIHDPGRALLALERAGLVVLDAVVHAIDQSDLELAHDALAEVATSALGPLGRVVVRSDTHQAIRERYRESREAAWLADIQRAKGAA